MFRGQIAKTGEEAIKRLTSSPHQALLDMAHLGVTQARKGWYDTGLEPCEHRGTQGQMEKILRLTLRDRRGSTEVDDGVVLAMRTRRVLASCRSVPAAMTSAAALEMVGQPFLRDHECNEALDSVGGGPVHLIACHKSVTETQALRLLGFPDATIVTPPFGVYVADSVQKIQMVLLANCRDSVMTRHAAQRALIWLTQSGEADHFVGRSGSRKRIVHSIAAELG